MEEYLFLFGLAFVWLVFATVQDFRTREISNWLNFSLIAFALAYRAFYSAFFDDWKFFLFGLFGVLIFVGLGYLFYYARIFAGGDAKLLFGLGGVLPFESFYDYLLIGGGFVLVLFAIGAVYTLIYSAFLALGNRKRFKIEIGRIIEAHKIWIYSGAGLVLSLTFIGIILKDFLFLLFGIFLSLIFLIYEYVKIIEKVCMIKLVDAGRLTEGDWLERDVKIGKNWIRASVHGLSLEQIKILRRAKKKVWIKEGVPFAVCFLGAFVLGVWLWKGFWV